MKNIDKTIENKAREILLEKGLYLVPSDPVKLANIMNVKVKAAVFDTEDIAGLLSGKDDQIVIYVNSKDSLERKRFTVAHELGHFFLHHQSERVEKYRMINGTKNDSEEQDANKFAAALLMDEILVGNMWRDFPSISVMADLFKVSLEAMTIRLTNLGFIS